MLKDPDDIWVRSSDARKMLKLNREDLDELGKNYISKDNPFGHGKLLKQYSLKEVVGLALQKHSEAELLSHFAERYLPRYAIEDKIYGHYLPSEDMEEDANSDGASLRAPRLRKMYWYNAPSTTTVEGRKSVLQGLRTNIAICTAKGAVWLWTGSHVMFADLMHSIADVLNYSYRLAELNRSARQQDIYHPYGYAPLRYITADRSFVFLGFVGGIIPMVSVLAELSQAHGGIAMGDYLMAPAAVFVVSALLEGVAVKTAYNEILSLHAKEFAARPRSPEQESADSRAGGCGDGDLRSAVPSQQSSAGLREVLQYLREGRDVMSTATFTEASSGVLASLTGLAGIGASWYLQSGYPDMAASMIMAAMVCGVSSFLLRKSGNALLGQTLPGWRVKELVLQMEGHAAVVNVFDVKTEMVGTDTVRFKAEVQFNPQAITARILQVGALRRERLEVVEAHVDDSRAVISLRLLEAFPQLQRGVPGEADAAAWLYRNNALFYEALALELKDVEKVVKAELREFRNVHIDLEPW